jgi:hypothetical protein
LTPTAKYSAWPVEDAARPWWLATIAEKRGDTAHRLRCLRRASQFRDTRYGAEACKALGDDA